MNQAQIDAMLKLLADIAGTLSRSQQYTITGATDWPILAVVGGILIGLLAAMWGDLRNVVKEYRRDWKDDLADHKAESLKDQQIIWDALHDCQNDCCPRGSRKNDH